MVPIYRWTHCFGDISSPSMSWRRLSMPLWKIESNARGVPNGYWNISALSHQNCHNFLLARRERTRCQKAGRWRMICMRKTPVGIQTRIWVCLNTGHSKIWWFIMVFPCFPITTATSWAYTTLRHTHVCICFQGGWNHQLDMPPNVEGLPNHWIQLESDRTIGTLWHVIAWFIVGLSRWMRRALVRTLLDHSKCLVGMGESWPRYYMAKKKT